jgi:hypothetical protein
MESWYYDDERFTEHRGPWCAGCGDPFEPADSDARRFGRFCGRECEVDADPDGTEANRLESVYAPAHEDKMKGKRR